MADDLILRMQQLISELNEASDAYYNGQSERMTDYEWDARFDELRRLEQVTGTTLPDSPTQRVSEDSIAGQKEEHEFAALSLAKTKQVSELVKWAEGRPVWISWKLDGLTLVATYDNGTLTKVVTRGNGHIGTNITHLSVAALVTLAVTRRWGLSAVSVSTLLTTGGYLPEVVRFAADGRTVARQSSATRTSNVSSWRVVRTMPILAILPPAR